MRRRTLFGPLAIGAAAIAMVAMGASVASAATSGVQANFVGVGINGASTGTLGGPSGAAYTLTAVVVGQSPLVGTLSISYGYTECGRAMTFTLSSNGGTVSGAGYGECGSGKTLEGTVTSASGPYAGLVGHTDVITVDLSPGDLYLLPNPLIPPDISPSLISGSLSIS
jgi:hypothetical protein